MAVTVTIGNTIGAPFLGIIGSAILFGAIAVQVFMYYTHFPNDWRPQKIFVGMLMALTVIHLAFAIYATYFYVVLNSGNTNVQGSIDWSFKVQSALDLTTVLSVQGLYAWRVQTLGRHFSRVLPWVVVGIVGVGWVLGIILAVNLAKTKGWSETHEFRTLVIGSLAVPVAVDGVIAGTLCYYLNQSRSVFKGTNNRLLKIMHYALVCGFLTSACSLAALICIVTMPNTLIFVGINFLLPRLYLFSYMAMLNARTVITEKDASSYDMSGVINNCRLGRNSTRPEKKPTITLETEIITDQGAIALLSPSKYYPGVKAPQQATVKHQNADFFSEVEAQGLEDYGTSNQGSTLRYQRSWSDV